MAGHYLGCGKRLLRNTNQPMQIKCSCVSKKLLINLILNYMVPYFKSMRLLIFILSLFALTSSMKVKPGTGTGTVYFLRSTGWNMSAGPFPAFIDGELACKLNNKRYSIHQLPEGMHEFSVQFMGKKSKEKIER